MLLNKLVDTFVWYFNVKNVQKSVRKYYDESNIH